MSEILHNERISKDFYLMKVKAENTTAMGQFYMLRAWGEYPMLSRPISVFDADGQTVSFLYKVVGKGTEILQRLSLVMKLLWMGLMETDFRKQKERLPL